MRKVLLSVVLILGFPSLILAGNISGSVRGTLSLQDSPYVVSGDLIVNDFDTLRIEPGVVFRFNRNVSFLVYGSMKVTGTLSDSIKFVGNDTTGQSGFWSGIYLYRAPDESLFSFVAIRGASVGITIDQCNPDISFSNFSQNLTAIDCKAGAVPVLTQCLFRNNMNAGIRVNGSSPQIIRNEFYYNCSSKIESVIVYNTKSAGVIKQNILAFNDMSGIDCSDSSSPKIYHNTITNNEFGISVQNSQPEITNNVIFQNQNGLVMDNSTGSVSYNDIYGNSIQDLFGVPEGVGKNERINVRGDSCDQYYNFSKPPLLVNIYAFDFSPTPSSPLIDTGDPQNPGKIVYLGGAPDIGAIETTYVLPVELAFFRYKEGKLEWMTAGEKNNYGFNIRRGEDETMAHAQQIGFIRGNGTTIRSNYYSYSDPSVLRGKYYYQLEQIDLDGQFHLSQVIEVVTSSIVQSPVVYSAYPNPFNSETTFDWFLPNSARVSLVIYNIRGRRIATLLEKTTKSTGEHRLIWNGANDSGQKISSGVYYGILTIGRYKNMIPVLYIQ